VLALVGLMIFFFFYLCLSFLLRLALVSLPFLALSSSVPTDRLSSYECGFDPISSSYSRFCIKFFLLAIIYIIFDVEVGFLVPGLYSSSLVLSFTLVLLVGLLFEFAFGGLDWVV